MTETMSHSSLKKHEAGVYDKGSMQRFLADTRLAARKKLLTLNLEQKVKPE